MAKEPMKLYAVRITYTVAVWSSSEAHAGYLASRVDPRDHDAYPEVTVTEDPSACGDDEVPIGGRVALEHLRAAEVDALADQHR